MTGATTDPAAGQRRQRLRETARTSVHRRRAILKRGGAGFSLALGIVLGMGLAGCSNFSGRTLAHLPDGTNVMRFTSSAPPHAPPDQALTRISPVQVESSLRRITLRYRKIMGLGDPVPLFSDEQAARLARVLAPELPLLKPDERLRISGHEDTMSGTLEMDVFLDGPDLEYYFHSLGVIDTADPKAWEFPIFLVIVVPNGGQQVESTRRFARVRDPMLSKSDQQEDQLRAKLALLQAARKDNVLDNAQLDFLSSLAHRNQALSLEAWRLHLDKVRTLRNARKMDLMDEAAYATQLQRVNSELGQ